MTFQFSSILSEAFRLYWLQLDINATPLSHKTISAIFCKKIDCYYVNCYFRSIVLETEIFNIAFSTLAEKMVIFKKRDKKIKIK